LRGGRRQWSLLSDWALELFQSESRRIYILSLDHATNDEKMLMDRINLQATAFDSLKRVTLDDLKKFEFKP
jgi:hypothetical protein